MKFIYLVIVFFVSVYINIAHGNEPLSSRTEIYENPYFSIGYNSKDGTVTGYLAALRTAPGETNECKLFFRGEGASKGDISVKIANATAGQSQSTKVSGQLAIRSNRFQLVISKSQLPGDCDWVLPFVGYPTVDEINGQVVVTISPTISGNWLAVGVIQARKAYFHQTPENGTVQKAYLVSGDVLHIYDEKPGWYFVKFQGRKKEVVGWIRVQDTVQF